MKIPLDWLKEYIKISKSPRDIANSFTAIGLMLDKHTENNVLELEHRMDRADWLSIIGCARDLSAIENSRLIEPERYTHRGNANNNPVKINVKAKNLINRFNTRVFKNVKVGESPKWLKDRLDSYGIDPINNIVDITNYVMVEYGQPVHAQDLAKFSKREIVLREAKAGEEIVTLLGKTIELDNKTLVLSEGKNVIAIGGIVGGKATSVNNTTTEIILDAGNYNQSNIRKTSRRLGIRNETVTRTEKFLHPHLTQIAIERATKLILDISGGEYFENVDYYPNKQEPGTMELRYSRIKTLSGVEIDNTRAKNILLALGYRIIDENDNELKLEIPYFRTDVLVEDDIVSDILRINNFESIPSEIINSAPPKDITTEIYVFEDECRDILAKLGLREHITNPLVKNSGMDDQVILENALNSEQNALRVSINETLKPILEIYKKHKIETEGLFEVGKIYKTRGRSYIEDRVIECTFENSSNVKGIFSGLLLNLGVDNVEYRKGMGCAEVYQRKILLGKIYSQSFTVLTKNLVKADRKDLRVKSELTHKSFEDITFATKRPLGPIIKAIMDFDELISDVEVKDHFEGRTTIRVVFEDVNEIGRERINKIKENVISKLKLQVQK